MSPYHKTRLTELLARMAELLVNRADSPHETIGGLTYLVWEAGKLLELPEIDGLTPL